MPPRESYGMKPEILCFRARECKAGNQKADERQGVRRSIPEFETDGNSRATAPEPATPASASGCSRKPACTRIPYRVSRPGAGRAGAPRHSHLRKHGLRFRVVATRRCRSQRISLRPLGRFPAERCPQNTSSSSLLSLSPRHIVCICGTTITSKPDGDSN